LAQPPAIAPPAGATTRPPAATRQTAPVGPLAPGTPPPGSGAIVVSQAGALKMTGLGGVVRSSTSKTVSASGLTMTGLSGAVPASTSKTIPAGGLIMTGRRP
jgi:hypothetical protein